VPSGVPRQLVCFILILYAFTSTGAAAVAHAVLVASEPAAGQRLERTLHMVTLAFDEPVETALGSLRVLDASGTERSLGGAFHPNGDPRRIAVLSPPLGRGRYVVAWRVVSADSHIVGGAYAFGLGVPAGEEPPPVPAGGATFLLPLVHFIMLAGVLFGIGLPLGAAALGKGRSRVPSRGERGAWFAFALAACADVAVRANLAGGSPLSALTTRIGALRLISVAAALIALAAISGNRRRRPLLLVAGLVAALSLSFAGHAADAKPAVLGVAVDALHLLAAAAWIGVVTMAATLGHSAELRAIPRIAAAAVVALVATGVVQTIRNAGSLQALVTTAYGREIDLKFLLLIAALGIASQVHRAGEQHRPAARSRIKLELWFLVAIVAVTAVLVETPLPRNASQPPTVATSFSVRDINVQVTAVSAERRAWTLRVSGSAAGSTTVPLDGVDVAVRERRRNIGPLVVPMTREASGAFSGRVTLPFDGAWSASVSARSGAFDENHHTFSLTGE
jgi:copper transport protein